MKISEFIEKLSNATLFRFYLNDKLMDLGVLENYHYELENFEIEDNVIRLYNWDLNKENFKFSDIYGCAISKTCENCDNFPICGNKDKDTNYCPCLS